MRLDIFTLFPGAFDWFLQQRAVRQAIDHGQQAVEIPAFQFFIQPLIQERTDRGAVPGALRPPPCSR